MHERTATESAANSSSPRGSIREGIVLGLLLHIGVQTFLVFTLVWSMGLSGRAALLMSASYVGVSQLAYMIPAIVDASVLHTRRLTARGLLMVTMGTMGANLLALRIFAPDLL